MPDIAAPITGVVWKVCVEVGQRVTRGEKVAVLESMKLEIPIEADGEGTVQAIRVSAGDLVTEGDTMFVLS